MKTLKQYWIVLAIFLIVVTAILFRTFSHHNFKYNSGRWAEASVLRSNLITEAQVTDLKGEKLIISLEESGISGESYSGNSIEISPDSILYPKNLEIIRNRKGPVILKSSENGISARIWMLLSQMGIKNIYILTDDPSPEVLKIKFRPDTISAPE